MPAQYFNVFDCDNTLFSFSSIPDGGWYRLCDEANALGNEKFLPHLTQAQIVALSKQSLKEFGNGHDAFRPHAARLGMEEAEFLLRLRRNHQTKLVNMLMERHPDFFAPDDEMIGALREYRGTIANGILTNSLIEEWVVPVIDKKGYLPLIGAMMGPEQWGGYDFKKFESTEPLRAIMGFMNAVPNRTFFIEDSLPNLRCAVTGIEGVRGSYIHYGKELQFRREGVHVQFEKPAHHVHYVGRLMSLGVAPGRDASLQFSL